jgi:hypothetical protein
MLVKGSGDVTVGVTGPANSSIFKRVKVVEADGTKKTARVHMGTFINSNARKEWRISSAKKRLKENTSKEGQEDTEGKNCMGEKDDSDDSDEGVPI